MKIKMKIPIQNQELGLGLWDIWDSGIVAQVYETSFHSSAIDYYTNIMSIL